MRTIEKVFEPGEPHFVGDGFRVHNFIPNGITGFQKRMDPFIMMDYSPPYEFLPSEKPLGVGAHPHSGFETVTIACQGEVAHHDSAGNSGVIQAGGVQWMTAGRGILHKEYQSEEFSRSGGTFQMVQLWINLPARFKMVSPRYQTLVGGDIERFELEEDAGEIEIIAGKYKDVEGSVSTFSPVHLFKARLKKGGTADFSFPMHFNTALLVLQGSIRINDTELVPADRFVLFRNNDGNFWITAEEDAVVLVLSGEPFFEPIVQHGPFVMNSQQEIYQAIRDFNLGGFGYLED